MRRLSIGKIRGMEQIANNDGIFLMCAMDHRGSLRRMINQIGRDRPEVASKAKQSGLSEQVDYETMVQRKLELCSALAPHVSAVLLDPEFGAAQCIAQTAIPSDAGLIVSMEASGYSGEKEHRVTELLRGWGAEKIRRMGASAAKILVYYRPDMEELAARNRETVKLVAEDCLRYDLPFLVEPMSYPVSDDVMYPGGFSARRPSLVIESAHQLTALPIDVLKAEFPGNLNEEKDEGKLLEQCHQLDEASQVPWVILSAGVDYQLFCRQVELACRGGASGFLGGRAIWQEAMDIEDTHRRIDYLSTTVVDRLKNLTEIASNYATPWHKKLGGSISELAGISEKWFEEYQ